MTELLERVLEIEAGDLGHARVAAARRTLDSMAVGLAAEDPTTQVRALGEVIFRRGGLRYRLAGDASDFVLTRATESGETACLGLVLLFVGLAERVGWPLQGRLLEGHIRAVHLGSAPPLEIETTRGGMVLPDHLVARFDDSSGGPGALLNGSELSWVYRANRAVFVCVPEGRWLEAEDELRAVVDALPDYAAARLNLATLLRRRGRSDEATTVLTDLLSRPLGPTFRRRAIAALVSRQAPTSGSSALARR